MGLYVFCRPDFEVSSKLGFLENAFWGKPRITPPPPNSALDMCMYLKSQLFSAHSIRSCFSFVSLEGEARLDLDEQRAPFFFALGRRSLKNGLRQKGSQ